MSEQTKLRKNTLKHKLVSLFVSGKSLTAAEAYELYGTMTIGQRISELRALGYEIVSCDVHIRRNGQPPRRYWIEEYLSPEERTKHNIPILKDGES